MKTILLLLILLSSVSIAEIYVWIDENGKKHYTDDKNQYKEATKANLKLINSISKPKGNQRKQQSINLDKHDIYGPSIPKEYCQENINNPCVANPLLFTGSIGDLDLIKSSISLAAFSKLESYAKSRKSIFEVNPCAIKWSQGISCSKNMAYLVLHNYHAIYHVASNSSDSLIVHGK